MAKTVVGMFETYSSAQSAAAELEKLGFTHNDVSMVTSADTRDAWHGSSVRERMRADLDNDGTADGAERVGLGAGVGAAMGGLAGLLVGIGALVIPGFGAVVAAGPILAGLTGVGIGAAAGGLIGALAAIGIPEEHAEFYAEGIKRGSTLVTVRTDDARAQEAANILTRCGAINVDRQGTALGLGSAPDTSYRADAPPMSSTSSSPMSSSPMSSSPMSSSPMSSSPMSSSPMSPTTDRLSTAPGVPGAGSGLGTAHPTTPSSVGSVGGVGSTGTMASTATLGSTQTADTHRRMDATSPAHPFGTVNTLGPTGERTVPVYEEQVKIGKREVEGGGVRVTTGVTETPVAEKVTLRDEHVHVERRPLDIPVDPSVIDRARGGVIEVKERSEEVVVGKTARIVEEVVVRKDVGQHTEVVNETARRTDVKVENIAGGADAGFSGYEQECRVNWQSTYASRGGTYEHMKPAYQYGYNLANDATWRNRSWDEAETQFRSRWEMDRPGTWEQFKGAVRYAWERVRARAAGSRDDTVRHAR